MQQDQLTGPALVPKPPGWKRRLKGLFRSKDGAAAIEFALLAIPYFVIVFAIIETFIAYTAEQLVANAVDTMGRQLRTGNITFNHNSATDKNKAEFRTLFCGEISILIRCSATEVATPEKLFLDVQNYSSFAQMPKSVTLNSGGDLDTSSTSIRYAPGGPGTKNMLRAYYKWDIITDLLRPYITNIRPSDNSRPNYFLIVETSAYQNENYP